MPAVRKHWLGENAYIEVRYYYKWTTDGLDYADVYLFTLDPRKVQHHKPKFWSRSSSHGLAGSSFFAGLPNRQWQQIAQDIINGLERQ